MYKTLLSAMCAAVALITATTRSPSVVPTRVAESFARAPGARKAPTHRDSVTAAPRSRGRPFRSNTTHLPRRTTGAAASAGAVRARDLANVDRAHCVVATAGNDAAMECGDLRMVHPLPAVITMGTARIPTLIYNSQEARPIPVVLADVTLPSGTLPTYADAWVENWVLPSGTDVHAVGGTTFAVADWGGSGITRRMAVPMNWESWPATTLLRTYFCFMLRGAPWCNYAPFADVAVVNRSASNFGAGWSLAGLEELHFYTADTLLWVGGDGSTRQYGRTDSTTFKTISLDRPDSITVSGGTYSRWALGKVQVQFNASGLHVATINRLQDTTTFAYNSGTRQLSTISIAVKAGSPLQYHFYYGSDSVLDSVAAPGARTVRLGRSGYQITSITDPDSSVVRFTYGTGADAYRIESRIGRLSDTTTFTYNAVNQLIQSSLSLGGGHHLTRVYRPAESAYVGGTVYSLDSAYTLIDGPRTDVADQTKITIDSHGSATSVTDALGQTTTLAHADTLFPGLVTSVVHPNGFTQTAAYDTLGHLVSRTDVNPYGDSRNATTTYTWNLTWDEVASTVLPHGEMTRAYFNATTGLPDSTFVASDRTRYFFNASRLIDSVTASDGARDAFLTDSLGNIMRHTSPMGQVDSLAHDAIGRVTKAVTFGGPSPRITLTTYDAMSRPVTQLDSSGTDALEVHTYYGASGLVDSVTQWARPVRVTRTSTSGSSGITRSYTYDKAGRQTAESESGSGIWTRTYDAAGNIIAASNEPGDSLAYDALNRLVRRIGGPDSARYVYDTTTSALLSATNAFARIRRTVYPNGALHTDSSWVADLGLTLGSPDGAAVTYDLEGRRTQLVLPSAIGRTLNISYDTAATGLVQQVTDGSTGGRHIFHYDARGRLDSLVRRIDGSTPTYETRTYDLASQLHTRAVYAVETDTTLDIEPVDPMNLLGAWDTTTVITVSRSYLANDVVTRDGLGRQVLAGSDSTGYDALGHVNYHAGSGPTETFVYDAFGNRTAMTSFGQGNQEEMGYIYIDGSNAIGRSWNGYIATYPDTTYSTYTSDGALETNEIRHIFGFGGGSGIAATDTGTVSSARLNTYRSDKLVASHFTHDTLWVTRSGGPPTQPAYRSNETYRYDAFGRRVWQRLVFGDYRCATLEAQSGCASAITTTVWDGNAVLLERRSVSDSGYVIGVGGNQFGEVAYVHGLELDRPLVVIKTGSSDVLPLTRTSDDKFFTGTCPDTVCSSSTVGFPMSSASIMAKHPANWVSGAPWYGNQIAGMVDGTGYIYQRNRYLDPNTGLFTQQDPIGLAGGMNTYGFAGGDPVNFSDPLGLCPPTDNVNDCATTFWAERFGASTSLLGKAGNWAMGVLAACGESSCLEKIEIIGGAVGGGLSTEEVGPIPGESGGPGAGRDFSSRTKDAVRTGRCVFCGDATTREAGPKQSNIDHSVPKVRGGNNSENNAQETCRTCNLKKGTQTTEEYQRARTP